MTSDAFVQKTIRKIVDILIDKYHPIKIILFGSYAHGTPSADSDIDLLIIKNTDKRPIDRWVDVKRLLRDITRTLPISPLVYTEQEIKERMDIKDFFVEEILEKGEVLYG